MRIQDFLIGMMVFGLFLMVILGFAYSTYTRMGVTIDSETAGMFNAFEASANKTNSDIYGVSFDIQNVTSGTASVTDSSKSSSDNIIASAGRVKNIVTTTFDTFNNFMWTISNQLHIPSIFITVFTISMVLIVSMIFISSVLFNKL